MPINNQCLRLHQHIIGKSFLQRENKSEESERERESFPREQEKYSSIFLRVGKVQSV
jgi:hypothetical protein